MSVAKQTYPRVDGDFYHISTILSEEDQALLHQVQTFMEFEVAPIINHYWTREMNSLIVGRAITGFSAFV